MEQTDWGAGSHSQPGLKATYHLGRLTACLHATHPRRHKYLHTHTRS